MIAKRKDVYNEMGLTLHGLRRSFKSLTEWLVVRSIKTDTY